MIFDFIVILYTIFCTMTWKLQSSLRIYFSNTPMQVSSSYRKTSYGHDDFNKMLMDVIEKNHNSTKMIAFTPRSNSGFGNHIRGIQGLLFLSILNDARMCVDLESYFDVMDPSLKILRCTNISGTELDQQGYISMLESNDCNPFISDNRVVVATYSSAMGYLQLCDSVRSILEAKGLWRDDISKKIAQFLFQLRQGPRSYAEEVLKSMKGLKIGIQLRFGGSEANTNEVTTFLKFADMASILARIKNILAKYPQKHSIFLSTDSSKTKQLLSPLNETFITADKYALGHTYVKDGFLLRTVVDLYILSHCDVIIRTGKSSFGGFA